MMATLSVKDAARDVVAGADVRPVPNPAMGRRKTPAGSRLPQKQAPPQNLKPKLKPKLKAQMTRRNRAVQITHLPPIRVMPRRLSAVAVVRAKIQMPHPAPASRRRKSRMRLMMMAGMRMMQACARLSARIEGGSHSALS